MKNNIKMMITDIMAAVFELENNLIDEKTSVESLEAWDSLKHLQLIVAIEEEFDIEIPDEKVLQMKNYQTVLDTVWSMTRK